MCTKEDYIKNQMATALAWKSGVTETVEKDLVSDIRRTGWLPCFELAWAWTTCVFVISTWVLDTFRSTRTFTTMASMSITEYNTSLPGRKQRWT